MAKMNMPINRENEYNNNTGGGSGGGPTKIYRPLPDKAKEKYDNELIIPLFNPSKWKLFNPTPDEIQMNNMVDNNGQPVGIPADLLTFYFKLPVHGLSLIHI